MKSVQRMLSALLSLAMVFAFLTVNVQAAEIPEQAEVINTEAAVVETMPETLPAEETTEVLVTEEPDAARTDGICGDGVTWSYNGATETLSISGSGAIYDFQDPDGFGPQPANYPWAFFKDNIRSVEVSEGITYIGDYAFYDLVNLTSVRLPEGIWAIGMDAFCRCENLTEIKLPDSLRHIANQAFRETGLKQITIPYQVAYINGGIFAFCHDLERVTLPGYITKIPVRTFNSCESLQEITIPASVTKIENENFRNCTSLRSITFEGAAPRFEYDVFKNVNATVYYPEHETWSGDALQSYGGDLNWICSGKKADNICGEGLTWHFEESTGTLSISGSGSMYNYDAWYGPGESVPINYPWADYVFSIQEVEIGSGVSSIGEFAFSNMPYLYEITIPSGVEHIGYGAFSNCTSLREITFEGDAPSLGVAIFEKVNATAYYPAGNPTWTHEVMHVYNGNITWTAKADTVDPQCGDNIYWAYDHDSKTLRIVGTGEIYDYQDEDRDGELPANYPWQKYSKDVQKVEIYQGVTRIGDYAFADFHNLTQISIPSTVTAIGCNAFNDCSKLTQVTIPNSVTTIMEGAFRGCSSLGQIELPGSVTEIAYAAFAQCTALKAVQLPTSLESISAAGFLDCASLEAIQIPDGVTTLGEQAFSGCTSLTSVTVPGKVETLAPGLFQHCTGLQTVKLPDSLKTVENQAFFRCESLNQVNIPDGVMEITYAAFANCSSLTAVELPTNLATIHVSAFSSAGLESITLPEHLAGIAGDAFHSCVSMEKVTFRGDAPVMSPSAFFNVTAEASYPGSNSTWTADVLQNYGGSLTWVPYEAATVNRVSGTNRISTALTTSEKLKEVLGVDKFSTIVVANAMNFPDALSGSYLAAAAKAPILLYKEGTTSVTDYIKENLASGGTVYILGGESSVPESIVTALPGIHCERVSGSGRWGTSLKIIEKADSIFSTKPEKVLICDGIGFADSLSASATGLPILLVNGKGDSLREDQKAYLESVRGAQLYVIGGEKTITPEIMALLNAYDENGVERIAGNGRELTSAAVAKKFFPEAKTAALASSLNFPDGLSGGPVAYAMGAPLLLTRENKESIAAEYIAEKGIGNGYIIGGASSVTDASANKIFGTK